MRGLNNLPKLTGIVKEIQGYLVKLLKEAKQKAIADVYGYADTFSAVAWRKTLPKEYQQVVEDVIVEVYHTY